MNNSDSNDKLFEPLAISLQDRLREAEREISRLSAENAWLRDALRRIGEMCPATAECSPLHEACGIAIDALAAFSKSRDKEQESGNG